MQGRLVLRRSEERARAERMGITDPDHKFELHELASGDVIFAATGVTDGSLLPGVRFTASQVTTHTIVMRSATGTVRWIRNRRPLAQP
jgi:fructose-1,6-bisphosphatase II / sedoheptulose-1,7-bisphosphatase